MVVPEAAECAFLFISRKPRGQNNFQSSPINAINSPLSAADTTLFAPDAAAAAAQFWSDIREHQFSRKTIKIPAFLSLYQHYLILADSHGAIRAEQEFVRFCECGCAGVQIAAAARWCGRVIYFLSSAAGNLSLIGDAAP